MGSKRFDTTMSFAFNRPDCRIAAEHVATRWTYSREM